MVNKGKKAQVGFHSNDKFALSEVPTVLNLTLKRLKIEKWSGLYCLNSNETSGDNDSNGYIFIQYSIMCDYFGTFCPY